MRSNKYPARLSLDGIKEASAEIHRGDNSVKSVNPDIKTAGSLLNLKVGVCVHLKGKTTGYNRFSERAYASDGHGVQETAQNHEQHD